MERERESLLSQGVPWSDRQMNVSETEHGPQGGELRVEVEAPKMSFSGTKWSDDKANSDKNATSEKQSGLPGTV